MRIDGAGLERTSARGTSAHRMRALLAALQHADSAFPGGSFGFSNGIEGLAALGAHLDRAGLAAVVTAALRHRWAPADRVALAHTHRAGTDLRRIAEIDARLEAATLIEPLRVGSRRNGGALLAAHVRLHTPGAAELRHAIDQGTALGHLPVVQGFVWRAIGLGETDAIAMSAYGAAASLIAAAVRLGTIGAVEAQHVLGSVLGELAAIVTVPIDDDAQIESFAPWIDAAAARHVRAHVRLFAS
jgi:urease accessory protein